jgi:hypothetical protein
MMVTEFEEDLPYREYLNSLSAIRSRTSKWTMAGLTGIGCMGTWLGSMDGWNGDNSVYILPAGKSLSCASPPVNCICLLLHLQSSSTCSSGLGFRYTLKPIETQLSLLGWH